MAIKTTFGTLADVAEEIDLSEPLYYSGHTVLVGPPGAGKTEMMKKLIGALLKARARGENVGITILDSHGDLFEPTEKICRDLGIAFKVFDTEHPEESDFLPLLDYHFDDLKEQYYNHRLAFLTEDDEENIFDMVERWSESSATYKTQCKNCETRSINLYEHFKRNGVLLIRVARGDYRYRNALCLYLKMLLQHLALKTPLPLDDDQHYFFFEIPDRCQSDPRAIAYLLEAQKLGYQSIMSFQSALELDNKFSDRIVENVCTKIIFSGTKRESIDLLIGRDQDLVEKVLTLPRYHFAKISVVVSEPARAVVVGEKPTEEQYARFYDFHDDFRKRIENEAASLIEQQGCDKTEAMLAALILHTASSLFVLQEANSQLMQRLAEFEDEE